MTLTEKLTYVATSHDEDQEAVLARALSKGVEILFREARISDYLAGRCDREQALDDLGPDLLERVEAQKEAFDRDLEWALGA